MVHCNNHCNREDTDFSTSDATDTSLERLTLASEEGSDLDRVPGTDSNDDDHILSPFNKRKGNATDVTREVRQIQSHVVGTKGGEMGDTDKRRDTRKLRE